MFWYKEDVAASLTRLKDWSGDPQPVLFYGSSSFRLWESVEEDMTPWPILNVAFGGSTMAACAWYFSQLIEPAPSRALVLYAGDNDLGDGRHPEEVINQFQLIAIRWRELRPSQPLFFVSIKPSPVRENILKSILYTNERISAWCASRPGCTYIDIATPMLTDGKPNAQWFEADQLHLNRLGYQLWSPILKAALAKRLGGEPAEIPPR